MPIDGLTANIASRFFSRIGILNKGGPKVKIEGKTDKFGRPAFKMGPDLDYFRFVAQGTSRDEIAAAFLASFGEKPRVLPVFTPYKTPLENFDTWCKVYDESGLVHMCTGKTTVRWREGDKIVNGNKPCDYPHEDGDPLNDAVGVLHVVIMELLTAGFIGYVDVITHGKNDCVNIQSALQSAYALAPNRQTCLMGMPFVLRRVQETVGAPGFGRNEGKRTKVSKWLVKLEQTREAATAMIEAARSQSLTLPAPIKHVEQAGPDWSMVDDSEGGGEEAGEFELVEDGAPEMPQTDPPAEPPTAGQHPTPPPAPEKPANGNGKGVKQAALKHQLFVSWCNEWVRADARAAKYAKEEGGQANIHHILSRVAKEGFAEVTAENVEAIKAALKKHVEQA